MYEAHKKGPQPDSTDWAILSPPAPMATAASFKVALEGEFAGAFAKVVFAVTDWSPERKFREPFRDAFNAFNVQ